MPKILSLCSYIENEGNSVENIRGTKSGCWSNLCKSREKKYFYESIAAINEHTKSNYKHSN